MKKRSLKALILSGVLFLQCIPAAPVSAAGEMRDISTMELVRDMGIGINLGNTLEACPDWYQDDWIKQCSEGKPVNYETAWGSPVITKEIIEGIAKEGFGVLRIPVAWSNRMAHDGTNTIDAEYCARVHEIVDMTLAAGMYAIINIHWDGGWVNKLPNDPEGTIGRFTHMWEQIADSFADYGDHLMFEAQNEELGWESIWNPWGGTEGKAESYALCNRVNQAFVDVVRKSGGNNPKRHLLISGYNTGIDRTCDSLFRMPDDPANRMAISVHYYSPAGFAILEEDADWGKATPTWGSDQDYASLRSEMAMMKSHFTDRGIPVIIGEYGCPTKNKEPESVRRFLSSVCEEAYKCGHCPIMWSTPGGHYDREACRLQDRELQKLLYTVGGKEFHPVEQTTGPINGSETTTSEQTTDTVEDLTEPVFAAKPGDVDCSGNVAIADAVLLARYLAEDPVTVTAQGLINAELDGDSSALTSGDLSVLLQRIAGIHAP